MQANPAADAEEETLAEPEISGLWNEDQKPFQVPAPAPLDACSGGTPGLCWQLPTSMPAPPTPAAGGLSPLCLHLPPPPPARRRPHLPLHTQASPTSRSLEGPQTARQQQGHRGVRGGTWGSQAELPRALLEQQLSRKSEQTVTAPVRNTPHLAPEFCGL
ncbi:hypothetical protein P7K49_015156 [Saguinus oedipus]|uniref:Uncharacterized protein n=1 Tax=Saguinus oedipus TaxID=9490 RepID=A0ABQ9V8T8_SAGOE|nr:hypothetical protein P7K49_015156 [Saguinus oedipus]